MHRSRIQASFTPLVFVAALATTIFAPRPAQAQQITLPAAPAGVETFTREGIQFARVRAANVPAYVPPNGSPPFGAGSWDYAIARTELTQGQWVEMLQALNATPLSQDLPFAFELEPLLRGGNLGHGIEVLGIGPQGRFVLGTNSEGRNVPVDGLGWFGSAVYCNWLHNGRQSTIDSLVNGAYDLRTWDSRVPATWPTVTRSPNAQFWIPTYNEWAIASFYDPARFGPAQGGWWNNMYGRDRASIAGPPGTGETSAGWDIDLIDLARLPVAHYPTQQSPWGLFDTSGSRVENLEEPEEFDRRVGGTQSGRFAVSSGDIAGGWSQVSPGSRLSYVGFRIAGVVPAPATSVAFIAGLGFLRRRRSCAVSRVGSPESQLRSL